MKIKFNYYLKIKNIMQKEHDTFEIAEPKSIKKILKENIDKEKLEQIDLSELLIMCDGNSINNLNYVVEQDTVFSICPKIYGG